MSQVSDAGLSVSTPPMGFITKGDRDMHIVRDNPQGGDELRSSYYSESKHINTKVVNK